jgi:hypothetical protein
MARQKAKKAGKGKQCMMTHANCCNLIGTDLHGNEKLQDKYMALLPTTWHISWSDGLVGFCFQQKH